jgi:hypothetical protein
MSHYPVDNSSSIVDALNYLLSGPSGIGQNFQGMNALGIRTNGTLGTITNSVVQTYLTGMPITGPTDAQDASPYGSAPIWNPTGQPGSVNRDDADTAVIGRGYGWTYPLWNTLPAAAAPYSPTYPAGIPVVSITPSAATSRFITVRVNGNLGRPGIAYDNLTIQPFVLGQQVVITGATPSTYNGIYTVYAMAPYDGSPVKVILMSELEVTWGVYTSGAAITINAATQGLGQSFFTGNQAIVSVTGTSDRVFVSSTMSQLKVWTFTNVLIFVGSTPVYVNLEINRYRAVQRTTVPNIGPQGIYAQGQAYNGYLWQYDGTVVSVPTLIEAQTAPDDTIKINDFGDIVFNNIIDAPGRGLYLYAFQLTMPPLEAGEDTKLIMGASTLGIRSFTAQLIKR